MNKLVKYNNLNTLSIKTKINSTHLSNIQKPKGNNHTRFVPYLYNIIIETYIINLQVYGFLRKILFSFYY